MTFVVVFDEVEQLVGHLVFISVGDKQAVDPVGDDVGGAKFVIKRYRGDSCVHGFEQHEGHPFKAACHAQYRGLGEFGRDVVAPSGALHMPAPF